MTVEKIREKINKLDNLGLEWYISGEEPMHDHKPYGCTCEAVMQVILEDLCVN